MITFVVKDRLKAIDEPDLTGMGACTYADPNPCIIGQMFTPEERAELALAGYGQSNIGDLVANKVVEIVPPQALDRLWELQQSYDQKREREVETNLRVLRGSYR